MIQVIAPHFTAAIEPRNPYATAPILMWMVKRGWGPKAILAYCVRKEWKTIEIK